MSISVPASNCTRQEKRRALRLLSRHRGATDRLIAQRDVLQAGSRPNRFFWRAMLESFAFHYLHSPAFQTFCCRQDLHPSDLPDAYTLSRLPFVELPSSNQATNADITDCESWLSCPASAIKVRHPQAATPSATPELQLDARSLRRLKRSWLNLGNSLGLNTREKTNYLSLIASEPTHASFGLNLLPLLTRSLSYSVVSAQPENCLECLIREGSALRLIGSLAQLLAWSDETSPKLPPLPARSLVWVWDNWSQYPELLAQHQRLSKALNITADKVRFACLVPYLGTMLATCSCGHLHLPQTLRVIVRDSNTLEPVSAGEYGRLQLISPCLSSLARPSVLLHQTGTLRSGCACGANVPYLELTATGDKPQR